MKNRLSDENLIDSFVQDSIQNREVLLANPHLTAQSATKPDNTKVNQLSSQREGIVALSQLNHEYPEFWIRRQSDFWPLLNQTLANYCFLTIDKQPSYPIVGQSSNPALFLNYQFVKMPLGYNMICSPAIDLWRKWWQRSRKLRHQRGLYSELLIRVRQTWYPIQDLAVGNGLLFIKTLVDETALHSEDFIVWLEKQTKPLEKTG